MLNYNSEEAQSSISKFEQMLKTNLIYFFDAQEFEDIVIHYLGFGDNQLAEKALKMGLDQHPESHELMLLQSEMLILDQKYDMALELLDYIEKVHYLSVNSGDRNWLNNPDNENRYKFKVVFNSSSESNHAGIQHLYKNINSVEVVSAILPNDSQVVPFDSRIYLIGHMCIYRHL